MKIFKVRELRNDFIVALIISLFFISILHIFQLKFIFDNLLESLGEILTVSATLAGFLITSLTILIIFPENEKIKFLKLHPAYKYIFHAFILSIILFVVIAVLTVGFIILAPHIPYALLNILLILFVWAFVSLFRCIWLLKKMIDVYFLDSGRGNNENS